MMIRATKLLAGCTLTIVAATAASAQALPQVRALGPVLATSTEPFAAISQVRSLPGGRVIVNDNTGRRVVLFDSTFRTFTVIADTTSVTSHAYGSSLGGLIAYRGDSTLFVDRQMLTMFVIDPNGKIVRTIAVPQPNEVGSLIGGPYGTPGIDAQGRLVYKARVGGSVKVIRSPAPGQPPLPDVPDSGMVVRFDLVTRKVDTVAKFIVPTPVYHTSVAERWVTRTHIVNPLPWTDDWALLADGTVAVVHGREYRVDYFDATNRMTSPGKLPFDWQKLGDADKQAIIDSTRKAIDAADSAAGRPTAAQRAADSVRTVRRMAAPEQTIAPRLGDVRPMANITSLTEVITLDEMPDYRPPFKLAAARGDLDGNLWIRTTKMVNGGAVYDVINRQGVLTDRIEVPPGRVIAGFGVGGVVYMGVLGGTVARLERARFR
jgi:hypothetical protein